MSDKPEMIWTGTRWERNPELPPPPEPEPVAPKPGFYGGSLVPPNVAVTIPTPAIHSNPAPKGLGINASPSRPVAVQTTIPTPVVPPQGPLADAILSGRPLPTGLPQPEAKSM
jgi:hypothetical protein